MAGVQLGWADYLVFLGMVFASIAIGIYHGIRQNKNKTENNSSEYIMGNRKMSLAPVMLSLAASYISAILFLGVPAETFFYGGQYWLHIIGTALGALLAVLLYIPVFYPLKLISIHEYLYLRYDSRLVQALGAITTLITFITFVASVFYAPAQALAAVSGIPEWASIFLAILVSVIYTAFGGLKAVVWTDVLQSIMMLIGMIAVAARAIHIVGWDELWRINDDYGRLNFFVFDPEPFLRLNFWGLVFGIALIYSTIYGTGQVSSQRYSCLPSECQAKIAVLGIIPFGGLLLSLACLSGMAIFAYYAKDGCDPVHAGRANANQIMMIFATEALSVPGLPGLFMAAVWAGSLSSASSVFNSATAIICEDLVKPHIIMAEEKVVLLMKVMVMVVGALSMAMALVFLEVGGSVIEIITTFGSSLIGPLAALFIVGIFVPFANWQGGTAGMIVGLIYGNWLTFGSFSYRATHPFPPLDAPLHNCTLFHIGNVTVSDTTTSMMQHGPAVPAAGPEGIDKMYNLSFCWYKGIITAVSILVMVIASLIANLIEGPRRRKTVPSELLHPLVRRLCVSNFDLKVEDHKKSFPDDAMQNGGHVNISFEYLKARKQSVLFADMKVSRETNNSHF